MGSRLPLGTTAAVPCGTGLYERTTMKLSTRRASTGRVISIETDEELDLKSHGVFVDACRLSEHPEHSTINVDLVKTRSLRDSGVAMLLMLRELTGPERPRIRLLNCNPDIRNQLLKSKLGQQFQVV
jgi:anti-anti-sigma regulatory factor